MFVSEIIEEREEKARKQGSELRGYDDVARFVAAGKCDAIEACDILGVNYDAYRNYQSKKC